jgi:hypothetical protein
MAISESFSLKSGDFGTFSSQIILCMNCSRFIFVVKWQNFAKTKKKRLSLEFYFLKNISFKYIPFFFLNQEKKIFWFNFTKSLFLTVIGTYLDYKRIFTIFPSKKLLPKKGNSYF